MRVEYDDQLLNIDHIAKILCSYVKQQALNLSSMPIYAIACSFVFTISTHCNIHTLYIICIYFNCHNTAITQPQER